MGEGPLLAAVRVLDLASGAGDGVSRILADLGAEVLKIEQPGDSSVRRAAPSVAGVGITFLLNNANKRCAQLDPDRPDDCRRLISLAGSADIVIDSGTVSGTAAFGTSCRALSEEFGHLVTLSVTDFGTTGPHASWCATDAVFYALSSALSRTGPTSGTPVLPPDGVASATAAVQAAWAVLAAYFHRLRSGTGDFIDFSRFEAVVQALDPPFGSEGQAAVGLRATTELWRGRPRNQQIYPIFECSDGFVRICLLSARQWRGMRAWLGEPAQFAGPEFDTIAARYAASGELNAAIAELFAPEKMADLVTQGQARGVPIAAVLTPTEALSAGHFRSVGALSEATLAPDVTVTVPVGPLVVDGHHHGYRHAAPPAGTDEPEWSVPRPSPSPAGDSWRPSRPFDGIRILDLGVIVAGGELGRLFADLGAEVIKVESPVYPDGLRQAPPGKPMSRSWALTHRNEYSLGLDLRHPSGAELFGRLVEGADAVFANFKPGTLAALGFSYDRLRALNPAIVLAESSAFGDRGPWSAQMGYGPLVRASTGITRLWTSRDAEPDTFYDATTIFPDHVVGRLTAIAAVGALIRRTRTGAGAHVHISQAEAAINQLAGAYVTESAAAAGISVVGDETIHAVCPCAGDDEWCVISIPDARRGTVAGLMGDTDLPGDRAEVITALSRWTASRDKHEVAARLQGLGVAAAPMNRAADVAADPQIISRRLLTDMVHPLLDAPIPSETGPAPYVGIPRSELRPAPMPGEHTRMVCQKGLGLSAAQIDGLIADGALFTYENQSEKGLP